MKKNRPLWLGGLAVALVVGLVAVAGNSGYLQGKFSVKPSTISLCKTDTVVFSGGDDTVEDFINLATDMSGGVSCPYTITALDADFTHSVNFTCESSDLAIDADASRPLYSIECTHDFGDVSKQIRVDINHSGYALTDPASDHLGVVFEDERDNVFEAFVLDPVYVSITREAK